MAINQEPTNQDILNAVNSFSTATDKRFDKIEGDNKTLKSDVTNIRATMVTKDYLDGKLQDQMGGMVTLMRKGDRKLFALVDILKQRQVISEEDVKRIASLEPFPQLQ